MKYWIYCFLLFFACNQPVTEDSSEISADLAGFELEKIAVLPGLRAFRLDPNGRVIEEGFVLNGKRHGTWMSYHDRKDQVKTITSYVDGLPHGAHLELTDRGQIMLRSYYSAGQLDGKFFRYRFGTVTEEANYVNGQLEGEYKKFHNNGKPEQESNFVNGKREGSAKFYNDKGELILDYVYKDGEIVSGGKVDQSQ